MLFQRDTIFTKLPALLLLTSLFSGCTSLPDTGPFVSATSSMSSSVIAGGSAVETELRLMEADQFAQQFAHDWETRVEAMNALVTYASALNEIVEAGKTGASSAGALADAVKGLATTVGIALPPAGAAAVATDVAKLIYAQIALVRASNSLKEAVIHAQPAIEQIAGIIALDMKDAGQIFILANADIHDQLQVDQSTRLGFRNGLLNEQDKLFAKGADNLTATEKARLLEISQLLTAAEVWYRPLQEQLRQVEQRKEAGRSLFAASADATAQWSNAHKQLEIALQQDQKGAINVHALEQAALQIRDLINRMREL